MGYRGWNGQINPINPDAPMMKIVEERANYESRELLTLRQYQIEICYRASAFWKDFFPRWLIAHGFGKNPKLSLEAWKLLDEQASKEDNEFHERILQAHDDSIGFPNRRKR